MTESVSHLSSEIQTLIATLTKCSGGMRIQPVSLKTTGDPVFMKRRLIPLGIREAVHKQLMSMVENGILEPVSESDWATPIVTPIKSSGRPRICGDFRISVNKQLLQRTTTTEEPEDLMNSLKGASWFSQIDLKDAFLQIPISSESKNCTTINTPWGLFRHNFLPQGLSVSPGIFQSVIDEIIKECPGVKAYQDDVICFASDKETHDKNLLQLLRTLRKYNVMINASKSTFSSQNLSFLGYKISVNGYSPDPKRMEPLMNAPTPSSAAELKSLLGCLQYYSRFIPNFASIAYPLFELQNSSTFHWTTEHDEVRDYYTTGIRRLIRFSSSAIHMKA